MLEWLQTLLENHGYWVIFVVVLLNNLGLPIAGDMMILGGGLLAQKGTLSLGPVVVFGTLACFMGGNGGYWLGRRMGPRLLKKIKWFSLSSPRIERVEKFFDHYGAKVVFFARLVALLQPVTGFLAGIWKTPLRPFLFYNLAGSALYASLYAGAGYFLGGKLETLKIAVSPTVVYILLIGAGFLTLGLFLRRSLHHFFIHYLPASRPVRKRRKGGAAGSR